MPIEITMPRMSDTMEEGTLVTWNVAVGDKVSAGAHLADVETDKATMELESFDDGVVAHIAAQAGDTIRVGDLIMVLAEDGESIEQATAQVGAANSAGAGQTAQSSEGQTAPSSSATATATVVAEPPSAAPTTSSGRIKASPVARLIAEEHQLDLAVITGTGPDGRIIKRDVLSLVQGGAPTATAAAPKPASAPAPTIKRSIEAKTITLTNMRKTIARRLVESKTTIPHFTVTMSINANPLLDVRQQVNRVLEAEGVKLSVNDFIVRGAAMALLTHPVVNSRWVGAAGKEVIEQPGEVNIGVAVALPAERGGGLVVPTLRNAANMSLPQISSETKRLAKKAREQGLSLEEMSDGTFTISNLGMFGVDHFEAIINPPQAAILAIGAAVEKPVARDGQLVVGREMTLTLSADHRVVDGATAAEFLNTLKQLLEAPASVLV